MANFCLGDGRRLGKALPQHKLMQNLLLSDCGRKKRTKITIGTQTDLRPASDVNCCCRQRESTSRTFVPKQAKKVVEELQNKQFSQGYQNLLASIRERVSKKDDDSCCSCSGKLRSILKNTTWSDNSTGEGDSIHFPKETRNAMSLLRLEDNRHRRPFVRHLGKPSRSCAWPGVAERMDDDEEKRLINADEIVAKITSKLSKNKLDIN